MENGKLIENVKLVYHIYFISYIDNENVSKR